MPRKCVIKHCNSNVSGSPYTPTFTIPFKDHQRYGLWKSKIRESSDQYMKIIETDTVCIKHFEERFVMRSTITGKQHKAKLSLTKDAFPTLDLAARSREQSNETELTSDFINQEEEIKRAKAKRGSSGLANLQKARMKKIMRRERMKSMLKKRAEDRKAGTSSDSSRTPSVKRKILKIENTRVLKSHTKEKRDFFLSDRELSNSEQLMISLRLSSLVHNPKIYKNSPSSVDDATAFPTFNIIKQIDKQDKNPVTWSVEEACKFVKRISASRAIAEVFKSHDIDGEALVNLNSDDLRNYLRLDARTAAQLGAMLSQLRQEVIQRYTFI